MIEFNGVAVPTPSELLVGHQDISKAERNARGNMIMEIIATKVKLEMSWAYLTQTEAQALFAAVAPTFFDVTYPDPVTGARRTLNFYKGDRKIPMLIYRNGVPHWKDVAFNVIER